MQAICLQVLQSVHAADDATQAITNTNSKYRPDMILPCRSGPDDMVSPDDIILCIEIYRPDQAPSRGKAEQVCFCIVALSKAYSAKVAPEGCYMSAAVQIHEAWSCLLHVQCDAAACRSFSMACYCHFLI